MTTKLHDYVFYTDLIYNSSLSSRVCVCVCCGISFNSSSSLACLCEREGDLT